VFEQEKAEKEKKSERELKARVLELESDYAEEQQKLIAITSDMTRQYAAMLQVFYCIVKKTINLFY